MEFQLVSVRSGKDAEGILKAYKNIEKFGYEKKAENYSLQFLL